MKERTKRTLVKKKKMPHAEKVNLYRIEHVNGNCNNSGSNNFNFNCKCSSCG